VRRREEGPRWLKDRERLARESDGAKERVRGTASGELAVGVGMSWFIFLEVALSKRATVTARAERCGGAVR
jgi:hypothetical protein